jgi:hypothetical protein
MILSAFVDRARARIEKRRRYVRMVEEIQGLSHRDLADIRGNRDDMLRHAYLEVYGR